MYVIYVLWCACDRNLNVQQNIKNGIITTMDKADKRWHGQLQGMISHGV